MFSEIVRQLNWVDVLIIIFALRICYVGISNGLLSEFLKSLGTLCAIYLSLHYYTLAADVLRNRFNLSAIPLRFLDFLCFIFISALAFLLFVLLHNVISHFVKTEEMPSLNKWGGFIFAVIRAYLFTALLTFALAVSSVGYLLKSVNNSYLGSKTVITAPAIYNSLWQGFFSKVMKNEEFNHMVLEEAASEAEQEK